MVFSCLFVCLGLCDISGIWHGFDLSVCQSWSVRYLRNLAWFSPVCLSVLVCAISPESGMVFSCLFVCLGLCDISGIWHGFDLSVCQSWSVRYLRNLAWFSPVCLSVLVCAISPESGMVLSCLFVCLGLCDISGIWHGFVLSVCLSWSVRYLRNLAWFCPVCLSVLVCAISPESDLVLSCLFVCLGL